MVAGLILLAHAPPGNDTWETFDQIAMLGLDKVQFPQLTMAPFVECQQADDSWGHDADISAQQHPDSNLDARPVDYVLDRWVRGI